MSNNDSIQIDKKTKQISIQEYESLRQEFQKLKDLNDHIKKELISERFKLTSMQGYLYKYKSYQIPILQSSWEEQYFMLRGTILSNYKKEIEIALIPNDEVNIIGCNIEWEGIKRTKYWTFKLKDAAGCCLTRLSSKSKVLAEQWVEAISKASQKIVVERSNSETWILNNRNITLTSNLKEESKKLKERKGGMVGSTPVHKNVRSSILSSERLTQHPHPGIVNLSVVILIAANFRLILENLINYGLIFNLDQWLREVNLDLSQPMTLVLPILMICCMISYAIEKLAVFTTNGILNKIYGITKKESATADISEKEEILKLKTKFWSNEKYIILLIVINICVCLMIPLWLILKSKEAIISGFFITCATLVTCMKLISYAQCNGDLRYARISGEIRPGERDSEYKLEFTDEAYQYPENIKFSNFVYFIASPTLTYQVT